MDNQNLQNYKGSKNQNSFRNDEFLAQQVRFEIDKAVGHPESIQTKISKGVVTLKGVILAAEVPNLIDRLKSISGVEDVVNNLDVRKAAEGVPGLGDRE